MEVVDAAAKATGAAVGTAAGIASAGLDLPSTVSRSVVEWLRNACEVTGTGNYASCYYIAGLGFLLFLHYVLLTIEESTAFKSRAQGLKQAISEVRQLLQFNVVPALLYFGAFVGGVAQAAMGGLELSSDDLMWGMSYAQLIVVLLLVNKFCLLLTGTKNNGNYLSYSGAYSGQNQTGGQVTLTSVGLAYANVSVGGSGFFDRTIAPMTPALKPTSRPWQLLFTWLQQVTDIAITNILVPSLQGFALGKLVAAARA